MVPLALLPFFSVASCFCENPPVWTGVFLMAAGSATVYLWSRPIRPEPSVTLRRVGSSATGLAMVAASVQLASEIVAIF